MRNTKRPPHGLIHCRGGCWWNENARAVNRSWEFAATSAKVWRLGLRVTRLRVL